MGGKSRVINVFYIRDGRPFGLNLETDGRTVLMVSVKEQSCSINLETFPIFPKYTPALLDIYLLVLIYLPVQNCKQIFGLCTYKIVLKLLKFKVMNFDKIDKVYIYIYKKVICEKVSIMYFIKSI